MSNSVHYLNVFLGTGAIALQIFSVAALSALFFRPRENKFLGFIDKHYLTLGFIISLSASLFSLVYSEIINFIPCYLCWYQRIFLFPAVFIFGAAIWSKDRKIVKYVLPMLAVGFVMSVYQNFFYYFGKVFSLPCPFSGLFFYHHFFFKFNTPRKRRTATQN